MPPAGYWIQAVAARRAATRARAANSCVVRPGETARQLLLRDGFTIVLIEQAAVFVYDGRLYDGGSNDNLASKFIVIGRK